MTLWVYPHPPFPPKKQSYLGSKQLHGNSAIVCVCVIYISSLWGCSVQTACCSIELRRHELTSRGGMTALLFCSSVSMILDIAFIIPMACSDRASTQGDKWVPGCAMPDKSGSSRGSGGGGTGTAEQRQLCDVYQTTNKGHVEDIMYFVMILSA